MVTLDTNVLIYSVDDAYPEKRDAARLLVDSVFRKGHPLALQVCGEFYRVATGKLKMPLALARGHVLVFLNAAALFAASREAVQAAIDLTAAGRLSFWDANLVCAADLAGCTHLLSEDMGDGARFGGIEVVNPFSGGGLAPRAATLLDL